MCIFLCVLESVSFKLLCDFGFMCESVFLYGVCITLCVVNAPLTQRHAFPCMCVTI